MSKALYDQDNLAGNYTSGMAENPVRQYLQLPSFIAECGKLGGCRVLDVACGSGTSTRLLARQDARTIGIDVSHDMLRLAREIEAREPLGIPYLHWDARELGHCTNLGQFDLATAAFLFHYAKTFEDLKKMARGIGARTRTNGRLCAVVRDPGHPIQESTNTVSATSRWLKSQRGNGAPMEVTLRKAPGVPAIVYQATFWGTDAMEEALGAAGFDNFKWIRQKMTEEGKQARPDDWQALETENTCCTLTADKKLY